MLKPAIHPLRRFTLKVMGSGSLRTTPKPSGAKESELEGISCSSATACIATGTTRTAQVLASHLRRATGEHLKSEQAPGRDVSAGQDLVTDPTRREMMNIAGGGTMTAC